MRKIITVIALIAGLVSLLSVAGCGSGSGSGSGPATYAPAAYGAPGHCYYIQDPAEAIALEQAGLCPRGWVPTLAPLYWQQEYWPYYSSPAYYSHYVPARYRTAYVTRERTFGRSYRSAIAIRSRAAVYRSSAGGTVKGSKVLTSRARFGSGTAGVSYGGGKRSGTSGYSGSRSRSGSSGGSFGSRSGSGSFGGGSRSSGGGKR